MNNKRESEILRKIIGPKFEEAMARHNGFVAGGAVRGVFSAEHITDVDIFFNNRKDFDDCLGALAEDSYSPSFTQTDSAWTHISTGKEHQDVPKMRYQLICAEFGTPPEVIAKFDFTMCMGAWDPDGSVSLSLVNCS